jgi:hypothetical protein
MGWTCFFTSFVTCWWGRRSSKDKTGEGNSGMDQFCSHFCQTGSGKGEHGFARLVIEAHQENCLIV